jgi:hypothetical protein
MYIGNHQVLLLMHNPLHQQLQQQEQLRSQHVQQQQAVSRSQVTVHPTYTFTPSVVSISGTGLVTAIQVPIPLHNQCSRMYFTGIIRYC